MAIGSADSEINITQPHPSRYARSRETAGGMMLALSELMCGLGT